MAGVPQQQQNPAWLQNTQQQAAASEEASGMDGVNPQPSKFAEGVNHFRLLPPAEAIPAALAQVRQNQHGDWSQGFPPVCRFQLYLPQYNDGDTGGISAFGSTVMASPLTRFFNDQSPVVEDPIQKWLDSEGIKWMKKADLDRDKRAAALRAALAVKDRIVMQIVNFGVVNPGLGMPQFDPNKLAVSTYFLFYDDFQEGWFRPLLAEPNERGFVPFDPFWRGLNFTVTRVGQRRDTKYQQIAGIYGPPYTQFGSQWGYALVRDAQGHPNMPAIEKLLSQVKPWREVIKVATHEELKAALDRTVDAINKKFSTAMAPGFTPQAPAGGFVPPAPGGGYAAPGAPTGAPAYPPAGGGYMPPAPPAPPGSGGYAPPAPPAAPQAGLPATPPAPPVASGYPQAAPPPPNYGAPQPAPGGYPQQNYQPAPGMQSVPPTPPGVQNLSGPPSAQNVDPRQMQQFANQQPPAAPPQAPVSAPPGAPPAANYGPPPAPPAPPQGGYQQPSAPPAANYGPPPAPPAPPQGYPPNQPPTR